MSRLAPAVPLLLALACVDRDRLAAAVEPTCADPYPRLPQMTLPPMARGAEPAPDGPVLTVTEGSVELDGRPIGEAASLAPAPLQEALAQAREHEARLAEVAGGVAGERIALAADVEVPARTVAVVLRAVADAGFDTLLVLGAPRSAPEPPLLPAPELAASLRSGDDALRAMRRAEAIRDAIWLCPDLTTIFSALAAADPAERCELMVAAFREMSAFCFANYDALVTVLLVASTPEQYTTFKSYTLAPGAPIGAAESWGGLVKSWGDATSVGVE